MVQLSWSPRTSHTPGDCAEAEPVVENTHFPPEYMWPSLLPLQVQRHSQCVTFFGLAMPTAAEPSSTASATVSTTSLPMIVLIALLPRARRPAGIDHIGYSYS